MEQARVPICLLQIFAEMFIGPFGSQAVVDREKESTKGLTENSSIKNVRSASPRALARPGLPTAESHALYWACRGSGTFTVKPNLNSL
jgi:hypothetical protein